MGTRGAPGGPNPWQCWLCGLRNMGNSGACVGCCKPKRATPGVHGHMGLDGRWFFFANGGGGANTGPRAQGGGNGGGGGGGGNGGGGGAGDAWRGQPAANPAGGVASDTWQGGRGRKRAGRGGGDGGGGKGAEDDEEERANMVAAACLGVPFAFPPRVLIEEVEEKREDRGEALQAGSPFAVVGSSGGGGGAEGSAGPVVDFPESAGVKTPFPKGEAAQSGAGVDAAGAMRQLIALAAALEVVPGMEGVAACLAAGFSSA